MSSSLRNLQSSFKSLETKVLGAQARYEQEKKRRVEQKARVEALKESLDNLVKALTLTQDVAARTQEQLEYQVSDIVTTAIQAIFKKPYRFKIVFEMKRGKTEAEFCLVDEAGNLFYPEYDNGGGVLDVVAFVLRLSCWRLMRPRTDPVMLFDEPLKFVSEEYRAPVAEFVAELVKSLGMQVIMVTHEPAFVEKADNIVRIS